MGNDIKWFLGLISLFALLWIAGGGVNGPNTKRPFIRPITEGGGTYGEDFLPGTVKNGSGSEQTIGAPKPEDLSNELEQAKEDAEAIQKELEDLKKYSVLRGQLRLQRGNFSYQGDPNSEQLIIYSGYQNSDPVKLTGLTFKSTASGAKATIGKGIRLIIPGTLSGAENIFLPPGGVAYISTGRSPVGSSFQLNSCTGYFEENNDFYPSLPTWCPAIKDEPLPEPPNELSDSCMDFIDTMWSCSIPELPIELDPYCQRWIAAEVNYNRCVDRHKSDADFYKGEWRIYLGYDQTLWKTTRESIQLLDPEGKVIDEISY